MSALSNYLENKLIDHVFRGTAFSHTTPASFYIALYTAAPSDAGGGTEVSGGSYARQAIARSTAAWAATDSAGSTAATSSGTGGVTSNNAAITFTPTPSASWGTVTHFGILDASTGGNLLFWGALTVQQTINQGNTVSFAAGQLQITFA